MTRLPQIAWLADGRRLHLQDGPIDLIIEAKGSELEVRAAYQAAARRLLSRLDAETGERIRRRSLDTSSAGNARQRELRDVANTEGYAEPQLWTGIGRARSGAGAAIVGDPDQVLAKLRAYQALGMEAFILSGYPHVAEGDLFARHVLPHLDHAPLFSRLGAAPLGGWRLGGETHYGQRNCLSHATPKLCP